MSTGKIELSVGAVKYVDPNEIITEEEYNYIKNKVPELDERVDVIEDEIEEINSSLDNKADKTETETSLNSKADKNTTYSKTEVYNKSEIDGKVFTMSNMGQDVKEAMTGSSVAVVGKNAVDTINLMNNSVTADKRTVSGDWGVIVTSGTINFDFDVNKMFVTVPSTAYIHYHNKVDVITSPIELDLILDGGYQSGIILYDVETKLFRTKNTSQSLVKETEVMIGNYHLANKYAKILGSYTVDGNQAGSNGKSLCINDVDRVYLRGGNGYYIATKKGTSVKLETTAYQIYFVNYDGYYYDISLPIELRNFTINHNECLVINTKNRTVRIEKFGGNNRINYIHDKVLLHCYDGYLAGDLLPSIANYSYLHKGNHAVIMGGKELLYRIENIDNGTQCDITIVKNELWVFSVSNDDNSNWTNIKRYSLDDFTLLGSIKTNWGHCNTVDYNPYTDCLILGNGSKADAEIENKFYIFENISSKSTKDKIDINEAVTFNLDSSYGIQLNAIWGDSNMGRYNIAHLISNDGSTQYIRKILLGMNEELENGEFREDTDIYNGTFKILSTYTNPYNTSIVNQGACWYNGKIYEGYGHGDIWIAEKSLRKDGLIDTVEHLDIPFNDDGTRFYVETQGVCIHENRIYVRNSTNDILVYKL